MPASRTDVPLDNHRSFRWSARLPQFILAVAVANAVLYHRPLFSFAAANLDWSSVNGLLTLATSFVLVTFVTALILSLLSLASQRVIKPLCMIAAIGNSIALYFVETFGVVIDKSMMGNVFNTHVAEATELLHPKLALYVVAFGLLPSLILARVQVISTSYLRRVATTVIVLVCGVGWAWANAKTWLWIDQHARRLGGMTMPWSYIVNASRYYSDHLTQSREQTLLPPATFTRDNETIVILIIGESARAKNFSLYGYARPTNPLLANAGVVALPKARSCSTYTTASVACILAPGNPNPLAGPTEPLTSYLQRHGVDVVWRTTNWGEPPMKVAAFERGDALRQGCDGEACRYDELLLRGLGDRLRSSTSRKRLVVLHSSGSHGPAYHTKYPPRFETFKPVCRSVELDRCSSEELINAYDNTILYTDHFVHQAIELLRTFGDTPTVLLYISDHGESLGEFGLYLHGTPWSIAPDVQKDIPFLIWMSAAFERKAGISAATLGRRADHSHANVFHSVMGAFDMRSESYRENLDLFSGVTR